MTLKGIIFDMDGVLTETSDHHYRAWKHLADGLGIPFDKEKNQVLKGVSRRGSLLKIIEGSGKIFTEADLQALMTQKNDHYLSLIEDITPKDLNPGIFKFLCDIKARGLKIAVASASHSAPMLVKKLGIEDYIDYIADPSTCASKPAPDIFMAAAQGLGLTCRQCVGIEDAQAGVVAIHQANMMAVGIGVEADVTYPSTKALNLNEIETAYDAFNTPHHRL